VVHPAIPGNVVIEAEVPSGILLIRAEVRPTEVFDRVGSGVVPCFFGVTQPVGGLDLETSLQFTPGDKAQIVALGTDVFVF